MGFRRLRGHFPLRQRNSLTRWGLGLNQPQLGPPMARKRATTGRGHRRIGRPQCGRGFKIGHALARSTRRTRPFLSRPFVAADAATDARPSRPVRRGRVRAFARRGRLRVSRFSLMRHNLTRSLGPGGDIRAMGLYSGPRLLILSRASVPPIPGQKSPDEEDEKKPSDAGTSKGTKAESPIIRR